MSKKLLIFSIIIVAFIVGILSVNFPQKIVTANLLDNVLNFLRQNPFGTSETSEVSKVSDDEKIDNVK